MIGIYFLVNYSEDLNKEYGLQDCGNIFTGISYLTANCLAIIVFIPRSLVFSIFAFCSSFFLAGYNTYNIDKIPYNCSSYYKETHNNMWLYYNFGLGLLYTNVLLFIIKSINFGCKKEIRNINDDEARQHLLNEQEEINKDNNNDFEIRHSIVNNGNYSLESDNYIYRSNNHNSNNGYQSNIYPNIYEDTRS